MCILALFLILIYAFSKKKKKRERSQSLPEFHGYVKQVYFEISTRNPLYSAQYNQRGEKKFYYTLLQFDDPRINAYQRISADTSPIRPVSIIGRWYLCEEAGAFLPLYHGTITRSCRPPTNRL